MSVDSVPANREFAKQLGITFPLLSDFQRTVVKDYGVFNEEQGFGNRATFLIDKQGIVRWIDKQINPTTHGLDVLAKVEELEKLDSQKKADCRKLTENYAGPLKQASNTA